MGKIYEQLSIEERTMIQTQLEMGIKQSAIALGVESFGIDREILARVVTAAGIGVYADYPISPATAILNVLAEHGPVRYHVSHPLPLAAWE